MKVVRLILGLVLLASAPWLGAATHPVPLDKNTHSAKCIECHEDKAKGKNVHSAIAMGCTSCHEIRVNKDVTRVKLITTTPQALCITCHADKNAADLKGKVHPPGVRDCLKCHDPHQSDNKFQLLQPTSGDKGQNLCLTCHTQGLNVPEKGSRHAAFDMGCDTCHTIHKTGEPGKMEFDVSPDQKHSGAVHRLPRCERRQPDQGAPGPAIRHRQLHSVSRSAPVGAAEADAEVHPSAVRRRPCDTCHQPAKDGKVVLTQSDSKALCVTCHAEQAEKIEKAKVQHPGAQGDCVACHNPHAGKTPGFIQPDPVNACLACHSEQADQFKKAHLHQPAFGQGCAICHEPHGGDNEHLLRAKGNALCLECHGPDSQPQKTGIRAPDHHLQRQGEAARRLLRKEQGRDPSDCDTAWVIRWKVIRFPT